MKRRHGQTVGLAPRRQHNWDWRAAANFICGGAGGGLLFWTPWAVLRLGRAPVLLILGLVLVATGLTCVWFEIGRPWRALNVFRNPASSWMTRESWLAPVLFLFGAIAVLTGDKAAVWICGLTGGAFLYSQARMLAADIGIPAWRNRYCVPLVVATNVTEGAAIVCIATLSFSELGPAGALLTALLVVRVIAWRLYLVRLARDRVPQGSLAALRGIDLPFVWLGNVVPGILATLGWALVSSAALAFAGGVALASGWWFKSTLVNKAAFTQGFGIPHLPVRGRAVKTG
jgi:phenylacetyl-CoA:acceptor oxidoreductase subunit 2